MLNKSVLVEREMNMNTMKKIVFIFCLLTVEQTTNAQTQIIAHRGFWKMSGSAQNSIAALQKADSIGVYGSEVDVWLSRDGVPVVNHDDSVYYAGSKLSVQDTDAMVLQNIRLENGEPMPTLEDYLDAFDKTKNIRLIIELKKHRTKAQEDELADKVLTLVKTRKLNERVEYISFGLNFTTRLIHSNPQAKVYYLNGDLSPQVMKEIGAAGIDYHYSIIARNPDWIRQCHQLGLQVNVWTVNNPKDIQSMLDLNVDFITTDNPLKVQEMTQKPLD